MPQPCPQERFLEPATRLMSFVDTDTGPRSLRKDAPVEAREPLQCHLALPRLRNLKITPRTKAFCNDVLRARGEPLLDVFRRNDEILSVRIFAADHDMRVRMAGIVVINSEPVEARPEIRFHLCHQGAGGVFEVAKLPGILSGNDQPELVPVAFAALYEGVRIRYHTVPRVNLPPRSIAFHAVALEIAEMGFERTGTAASRRPGNMGLHDDPSHPESRQALSAHFNRPRTRSSASDSSTAEPCFSGLAAKPGRRLLQLLCKPLIAAARPVSNPPETRLELIRHMKIPQTGYGAS